MQLLNDVLIKKYLTNNHKINEEGEFEKVNLEFCKLREGLTKYTNKEKWIKDICNLLLT